MTAQPKHLLAIKDALANGARVDPENGVIYGAKGRPLTPRPNFHGYAMVRVFTPGLAKRSHVVRAHKVVGYALWGDAAFAPGVYVRHLDADKMNFRGSNLAVGTPSLNRLDVPAEVRSRCAKIARASQPYANPCRKLTDDEVRLIRRQCRAARAQDGTQTRLALALGVSLTTISEVSRGLLYRDVADGEGE